MNVSGNSIVTTHKTALDSSSGHVGRVPSSRTGGQSGSVLSDFLSMLTSLDPLAAPSGESDTSTAAGSNVDTSPVNPALFFVSGDQWLSQPGDQSELAIPPDITTLSADSVRGAGATRIHSAETGLNAVASLMTKPDSQLSPLVKNPGFGVNSLENDPAKAHKPKSGATLGSHPDPGLDGRSFKAIQIVDVRTSDLRAAELIAVGGSADVGTRQAERPLERGAGQASGVTADGMWGGGSTGDFSIRTAGAFSESTVAMTEAEVTEQVKYWVSQEVQNAEMKLDGLGQEPVEVSISLHGNEAQVEFRSDQATTRDALEGAVSHLKELMERQGLVLSGVSVGTSGQDRQNSGEPRHPASGRKAMGHTPAEEASGGVARTRLPSARAIDLYV